MRLQGGGIAGAEERSVPKRGRGGTVVDPPSGRDQLPEAARAMAASRRGSVGPAGAVGGAVALRSISMAWIDTGRRRRAPRGGQAGQDAVEDGEDDAAARAA